MVMEPQGSGSCGHPVVEYVKQRTAPKVGRRRDIVWIRLLQLRDRVQRPSDERAEENSARGNDEREQAR
ncbi:eukaryotic peptide chain release factor GTP-binding subunit [Purpureocillium lavendulum]|uniref:Eukaryotic peptide chain release factor GTP-binding subunit n=1 Tax=Purpureocillium lavendulum TaxID=1247861 RepID=A0AB34FN03_9HYPO|nr:eukaryotic peptide chain release factor GTP-binding subunit [Purpureocillium lavendulum]